MTQVSQKILMISPIPTHPRNAGHRERIYQLMRQMQAFGHDIHLLHVTLEPGGDLDAMRECWGDRLHVFQHDLARTPYRCSPSFHGTLLGKFIRHIGFKFGRTINFPYAIDDWYDSQLDQDVQLIQETHHFDTVILEYLFLSKALQQFSADTRKVIDTIDVFTNRHRRYIQQGATPTWFSTTRREERKALRRADVIIAIQEHERRFFQQLAPEKQVITVGHFVELRQLPFKTEGTPTLLFFASSNPINVQGFECFLRETWPIIQARVPNVKLIVAGSACQALPDSAAYAKLGAVGAAQDAYALADVVISPICFGTGLKIKNVEALGYAKPLVTTPSGAEGLEHGQQTAFWAAQMPDDFARRVGDLLTDPALRRKMCEQAYQFAADIQQQNVRRLAEALQCA